MSGRPKNQSRSFDAVKRAALQRVAESEQKLKAVKRPRRRSAVARDEEADNLDCTPAEAERQARVAACVLSGAFDVAPENYYRSTRGGALESEQRQQVMWLLRKAGRLSLNAIAEALARDRSTVAHGVEVIEERRLVDANVEAFLAELSDLFVRLNALGRETTKAVRERAAA